MLSSPLAMLVLLHKLGSRYGKCSVHSGMQVVKLGEKSWFSSLVPHRFTLAGRFYQLVQIIQEESVANRNEVWFSPQAILGYDGREHTATILKTRVTQSPALAIFVTSYTFWGAVLPLLLDVAIQGLMSASWTHEAETACKYEGVVANKKIGKASAGCCRRIKCWLYGQQKRGPYRVTFSLNFKDRVSIRQTALGGRSKDSPS